MTHARGRSTRIALPLAALLALPLMTALAAPAGAAGVPTYRGYLSVTGGVPHYTTYNTETGAMAFSSGAVAVDGTLGPVTDQGATVVYVSEEPYAGGTLQRLHRVAPGGGDMVLYTAPKDVEISEPVVSSGGTTIAFARDDAKTSALLTLDVATKSVNVVRSSTAVTYYGPSFSPDGEYLSWAQESDTLSQVVITRLETGAASVFHTSDFLGFEDTAWSPDGTQLAVVRLEQEYGTGTPVTSIELFGLRDGTDRVVLRGGTSNGQVTHFGEPTWAPDSASLLVSKAVETGQNVDLSLVRLSAAIGSMPYDVATTSYAGSPAEAGAAQPADTAAPAPVTGLTASVSGASAHLTYTLPADSDLADVLVTRTEGVAADTATATIRVGQTRAVTFDVPLPAAGTDYGISVFARDWHGNLSPAAKVQVTSPAASALSVSTPPSRVTYRTAVRLTGQLTGTGPMDGQRVVLYARRAGTTTPVAVTSATTGADGSFAVAYTPAWTAEYQVRYAGSDRGYPAVSAKRVVSVVPVVSLGLSTSRVLRGGAVTLSGSVAPSHAGALVSVQRYVGGTWRTLASTRLSSTSAYRYVLRPATPGTWTLRVVKSADMDHLLAVSPTRVLTAR